jgi:hypothetical protein
MPTEYSRPEKITLIEEHTPELLPLVDAFLESVKNAEPIEKTAGQ